MPARLTDADITRARQIWAEYQQQHDVSDRTGQAVAIDPFSGRVWFGESGIDIRRQTDAEGVDAPILLLRVGRRAYWRKAASSAPKARRAVSVS